MRYGEVQGIGKPVSRLVQGTIMLSEADLAGSFALLDAVWAAGGTAFDTAHSYGAGEKERILGRWIAERGIRERVVILDKGAHPEAGRDRRVTPEDITADLFESLERLGTDYIDLYVLHRDDPEVPVGPLVEILSEHCRAGRIHAFGGSNWAYERVREANEYAAAHGLVPFAVSSPNFSLAEQVRPPWKGCLSVSGRQGAAARRWYREQGMPLFTWSSLAGASSRGASAARTSPNSPRRSIRSASRRTPTRRTFAASTGRAKWPRRVAYRSRRWRWPTWRIRPTTTFLRWSAALTATSSGRTRRRSIWN